MDLLNTNWSQCAKSGLNGLQDYFNGRFNNVTALNDKCYGNAPGVVPIAAFAVVAFGVIAVKRYVNSMAHRRMQVLNNEFPGTPFNQTNFLNACTNGHLRFVKACLDMGLSVNEQDEQLNTPLTKAAEGKQWGIAMFLLEKGADPSQAAGLNGETPLHHAAKAGMIQVVNALLKKNADLTLLDGKGRSPLHAACIFSEDPQENTRRLAIIKLLSEKGMKLDAVDSLNRTPIHEAAKGDSQFLKALLSQIEKKEIVSLKDQEGKTPLHEAAAANQPENVKVLLANKANINEVDNQLNTPLHLAGADAAKALLSNKAIKANLFNKEEYTPLMRAMLRQDIKAVIAMLETGKMDPAVQVENEKNAGMTLAHVAVSLKPLNRQAGLDILKVLISKYPEYLKVPNKDGKTPLHLAFEHYNVEAYKLLLACEEVNPKATDKEGLTPIDYAAIHGAIFEGLNVLPLFAERKVVFTMDEKKKQLLIEKLKEKFLSGAEILTKAVNLSDVKELQADLKAKKKTNLVKYLDEAIEAHLNRLAALSKNMLDPKFRETGKLIPALFWGIIGSRSLLEVWSIPEFVRKKLYKKLEKFDPNNPLAQIPEQFLNPARPLLGKGFPNLQEGINWGIAFAQARLKAEEQRHEELLLLQREQRHEERLLLQRENRRRGDVMIGDHDVDFNRF